MHSDAEIIGDALADKVDLEKGGKELDVVSQRICAAALGCCMVIFLYLFCSSLGSMITDPNDPVWGKNDYRICTEHGDIKTAALVMFDAKDEIPEGCTERLFPFKSLPDVGDSLDHWAWAAYNAHRRGTASSPDNAPYILYFLEYRQLMTLLSTISTHNARRVCDDLTGVDRLRCSRNIYATEDESADWSWTKE